MRLLYTALWWIALPLVLLRLWRRGTREPGYRQHIGERLGFYRRASSAQAIAPFIWVHAVSVGETRAAQPLIDALLATYPAHRILLTHMTATGRATGQQLFAKHGTRLVQSYFPYDTGWMCARFLRHFKPVISILMETEVWPNMVRQCVRHEVPVMLANARLSARSLRRGKRFGSMLREAAAGITCVAAQSDDDAQRLREFGASQVTVTGSIKFDVEPPADLVAQGERWRQNFGARPVLLCASTREGEEVLILEALCTLPQRDFLLVMVPRHPQRFDEVAQLISARGLRIHRRSQGLDGPLPKDIDIVLGDSMGEMFGYYAACDLAFIGGSLLPLGGQNLIEACSLGKPVLIGPHTFNFELISRQAIEAQAALRVEDESLMLTVANRCFLDKERLRDMALHAQIFARQHQGATLRTLALIRPLLS
ncbi:3-deoxy-D-manno-octulosonic-acid transferase [Herbaspirillum sp. Sphag1AN]|uniref:lipid IV(A) 3-deoxy-D-manno-octulosonic acid transferase n=1 Tax=unclassified Herbaspirillum TaxID=2624150 RepID=UPI00161A8D2A|nr:MULTISPECIES: lipid IV(A) 3-deoxy-D-manno-octulosonic acid transferase [unclassified Herbaspirillum]MBB3212965.1 3-deoxy-D-manno-octulosonic-acid transferase [Herbaspirillum sp. Sphag1AN]MBB3246162.1 3-deoxy-D-manno-octulosonic-acid transferase [Herbaspirillum sp. Sphag64]